VKYHSPVYPILHGLIEPFISGVQGFALAEITAEKLRALLQSQEKLTNRGWGASRVCRDYYDLCYILSLEILTGVPALFSKKCTARRVAIRSPEEFTSPDLVETARREWDQQLSPFLPKSPVMEKVMAEVKTFILALFQAG
jgi:predicted nucleotidyltransferase component of viral defense system